MKVNYCDLCDCPIHGKRYTLTITEDEVHSDSNFQTFLKNKSTKEVCGSCKTLFDKLFLNRKKGLVDLAEYIKDLFELKSDRKMGIEDKGNHDEA